MLIIKFLYKNSQITWFLDDNLVAMVVFLLTMSTGLICRRIKNSKKKIVISNPKGGGFIDECIEPDGVYEVIDRPLKIVLRQMLSLRGKSGLLLISADLFFAAYIASLSPFSQISILGVDFLVDKFRVLATKVVLAATTGSLFYVLPLPLGCGIAITILSSTLIFGAVKEFNKIDCDRIVSKVYMEGKVAYLEVLPEKSPKVFIKSNDDIDIYIPRKDQVCEIPPEKVEITKSKAVSVKPSNKDVKVKQCPPEYIPLKHRTKNLSDLKRGDSTEIREETTKCSKRYEDKRNSIKNRRL
jgi:hypothetical protein